MKAAWARSATIGPILVIVCVGLMLGWAVIRRASPVSSACPAALPGWDSLERGRSYRDIDIWINVEGESLFWEKKRISFDELRQNLKAFSSLSPLPYVKLDVSRAIDCRFATTVRDDIAANYPCGETDCWQGDHQSFDRSKQNPSKKSNHYY
jgi:hypothetical protein